MAQQLQPVSSPEPQAVVRGPQPPPPPREVGLRARRRSWGEPRVRVWWLSSIILVGATGVFVFLQYGAASRDRQLITHGTLIKDATITTLDGYTRVNFAGEPGTKHQVDLTFPGPDKKPRKVAVKLDTQSDGAHVGGKVSVYVNDPDHPTAATDHMTAGWFEDLFVAFIIIPIAVVVLLVAFIRRWQVLNIWREGQATQALVVDSKHSASHPASQIVRMILPDRGRRLVSAIIPMKALRPERGETVWVVAPPQAPQKAIVAALYE